MRKPLFNRKRLRILGAWLALGLFASLDGQGAAEFPLKPWEGYLPSHIRVGDILVFRIDELPRGKGPIEVDTAPWREAKWLVLSIKPTEKEGSLRVELVPTAIGTGAIPQASLAFQGEKEVLGQTTSLAITVDAEPEEKLKELSEKPPVPARLPARMPYPASVFWAIAAVFSTGVLVLGFFALRGLRRWIAVRRAKLLARLAPPPVSEDVAAIRALRELGSQGLVRRGLHKKHYFGVSDILKRYIGARWGLDVSECTTRELPDRLREGSLSEAWVKEWDSLFQRLDWVKFADRKPLPEESDALLDEAVALVERTRKRVVESVLSPSSEAQP